MVKGGVSHGAAQRGFTLIELMTVVIVLSLLLIMAIPNYADHLRKVRRNDARAALLEMAAVQERIYFERTQYSAAMADLWSNQSGSDYVSVEGFYLLSVTAADSNQTFTVTASAQAEQAGDTACASFSIDSSGRKAASDGDGNDSSSVCW